LRWQQFSQSVPELPIGRIINGGCVSDLAPDVIAAYEAPFPNESYKEGARQFPVLVPTRPDDPASEPNRRAWEVLCRWEKPFLTAFSDPDPVTPGAEGMIQELIPGAKGQRHTTIAGGCHFQEDNGEELARVTLDFIQSAEE